MKHPATDKLEIIRLVEGSHLGVKRTLAKIGVLRTAFYRWYDLYARIRSTLRVRSFRSWVLSNVSLHVTISGSLG